jgi:hypothetical protein
MQFDPEKHVLVKFLPYQDENVGGRLGRRSLMADIFPSRVERLSPLSHICIYVNNTIYICVCVCRVQDVRAVISENCRRVTSGELCDMGYRWMVR